MSRSLRFVVVAFLILVIVHRSPALIVEPPENATPAVAKEAAKRSSKSKRKSGEASQQNKPPEPAKPKERFAGTQTGKISQGLWGNVLFSFTLAPGASQVTENSAFGTYSHPVTSDGRTVTWNSGLLNEIAWTFTPNTDGTTARVTAKSPFGENGSAVFKRGSSTTAKVHSEIPTPMAVPEKPGFVYNPYDPTARRLLDVTGKPSGSKVRGPASGKFFIVL